METNQIIEQIRSTQTITLPVDDLLPYARNARTHSEDQVQKIAASIREFGFTNPILIDKDKSIIAGHGRVMAAKKLGLTEVPCITLPHLSEIQKKAYILADNQLALLAGWDEQLLKLEISELKLADFNVDLIGFTPDELEKLFEEQIPQSVEEIEGDIKMSDEIEVDKEFLVIVFDSEESFNRANKLLNNEEKIGYWLSRHKKNPEFFRNGPNRILSGELFLERMEAARRASDGKQ